MSPQTSHTEMQIRVMLLTGEVHRVKPNYRGLRIRSGQAWVTVNGYDLVLKRGEEVALEKRHDDAVVSSLGHAPLVIELLGEAPRHPSVDPRLVTSAR